MSVYGRAVNNVIRLNDDKILSIVSYEMGSNNKNLLQFNAKYDEQTGNYYSESGKLIKGSKCYASSVYDYSYLADAFNAFGSLARKWSPKNDDINPYIVYSREFINNGITDKSNKTKVHFISIEMDKDTIDVIQELKLEGSENGKTFTEITKIDPNFFLENKFYELPESDKMYLSLKLSIVKKDEKINDKIEIDEICYLEKRIPENSDYAIVKELNNKADKTYVDDELYKKVSVNDFNSLMNQKADKNNTYNKLEVDKKLADKADANAVYIKSEVDVKLEEKADKSYVDQQLGNNNCNCDSEQLRTELEAKADKTYVDGQDAKKADKSYVDTELAKKVDKTYVDVHLNEKVNQAYVDEHIGTKADKTYVNTELGKKTDKTYVDNQLETKADKSYVDSKITDLIGGAPESLDTLGEIAEAMKTKPDVVEAINNAITTKANKSYVDTELVKKTDKTYVDNQLSLKADKDFINNQLNEKVNQSYVDLQVATKADKSYVDEQLTHKVNAVEGKGLSTNDFTNEYKEKIDGITSVSKMRENIDTHENSEVLNNLGEANKVLTYRGKTVVNTNEYSFRTLPRRTISLETKYISTRGGKLPWQE